MKFAEDVQHDRNPIHFLHKHVIQSMKKFNTNMCTWQSVVRKQYKTDEWRKQLCEMKERLRPDNEVDIDDTKPAKKTKDLEKLSHMELTPA